MLKEFRDFVNRGNVVDLAIAVVLGAAFGVVIQSFVDDILMQIVAAIFGEPDFADITIGLGDAEIFIGRFLNVLIGFLVIAFAVFLVVKLYNRYRAAEDDGPTEVDLLTEIRDQLGSR